MIAIVDSGGANIASIRFALQRLGANSELTKDPTVIKNATHVIIPGVATAGMAMQQLKQYNLIEVLRQLTQPVLGICLGMQLFYEFSAEDNVLCLGIIPGQIKKLQPSPLLAVPHMGWNKLKLLRRSSLLQSVMDDSYVYFVHSFAAPVAEQTCAV